MDLTFQNLAVWLIVALAICALGHRLYKFLQGAKAGGAACGSSCGGCGTKSDQAPTEKPLVQLNMSSDKSS